MNFYSKNFIRLSVICSVLSAVHCEQEMDLENQLYDNESDFSGIVNGQPTNYESWQGAIGLISNSGTLCTGTLIDPEVVLSAGHCVFLNEYNIDFVSNPSALRIVGGANILTSPINYSVAAEVIAHPTWTGEIGGTDLSVIKLATPITSIDCYNLRYEQISIGLTGWIVGYGMTSATAQMSAGVHRAGETTIKSAMGGLMELGDPAGLCQGDSGGPFFIQADDSSWRVTGVTSVGDGTCSATGGSYDVNVFKNYEWIHEAVQELTGHGLGNCAPDIDVDDETGTDTDSDSDTDTDTAGDDDDTSDDDDSADDDDDNDDNDDDNDDNDDNDDDDNDDNDNDSLDSDDSADSGSCGCNAAGNKSIWASTFALLFR
jgi:secreted trypsin-like serine protease